MASKSPIYIEGSRMVSSRSGLGDPFDFVFLFQGKPFFLFFNPSFFFSKKHLSEFYYGFIFCVEKESDFRLLKNQRRSRVFCLIYKESNTTVLGLGADDAMKNSTGNPLTNYLSLIYIYVLLFLGFGFYFEELICL